jgi:hypothetical protein
VASLGGMDVIRERLAGFDIVTDFGPEKGGGLWENHKRSWIVGLRYPAATHHVVMEDDIELCPNFLDIAEAALEASGDRLVTFYSNRKVVEEAKALGTTSWVPFRDGAWGPALVLPSPKVKHFLDWDADNFKADWWTYDARLSLWAISNDPDLGTGVPNEWWWWATQPSLVEHLASNASTIGYGAPIPRVARWYRGTDTTPIDWQAGLADPPLKEPGAKMPWDNHWREAANGGPIWRRAQPWMKQKGWQVG